jgi:hypothetical protein
MELPPSFNGFKTEEISEANCTRRYAKCDVGAVSAQREKRCVRSKIAGISSQYIIYIIDSWVVKSYLFDYVKRSPTTISCGWAKLGGVPCLQLIATEPKLQISLIVSVQNLTSKNYIYCKLIPNELQLQIAAMYLRS